MNHRARINTENNLIISFLFIIVVVSLYFTFSGTTLENNTITQTDATSTAQPTTQSTTSIIKNIISNIKPDVKDDTTKEIVEKKDEVVEQIPQEQNLNQDNNTTLDIEKKIDEKKDKIANDITDDNKNDNTSDKVEENIEKKINEVIKKEEVTALTPIITDKIEFETIAKFYKNIKKSIKSKIKNNTNAPTSAKIRLTLFKNGRVDHMKFMGGDQEFYNFNKRRILWVFPVQIPQNLKDKFPRYFRMQIKGK